VPAPPATEYLELDAGRGVTLEVRVDGPVGPALVLLPSSLRGASDFDPIVPLLVTAGFRVLRPQPRGMGRSRGPLEALRLDDLASDIYEVIRALADGPAVVVGHAFGHFVARMTDFLHPEAVRGLVVLAGAARVFPPGLADSVHMASDPQQPVAIRLEHLRRAFFSPGHDASAWLTGWHSELRGAYRHAAERPPKDTWWPHARAPILEIQGEHDPWRPPTTRDELQRALTHHPVCLRLIPDASHAMVPEQPLLVAQAIEEWVSTL
jgi:pimeloyl-ACP methyl ester carboxylesterase